MHEKGHPDGRGDTAWNDAKSFHAGNVQPDGQLTSHSTKAGSALALVQVRVARFHGHRASHAEDEDTFALMARAGLRRREQSDLNCETKFLKVSPNSSGSSGFVRTGREHAADVLNEDELAGGLDDNAPRVASEVSVIEASLFAAGETMGLARNSTNEAVHRATPCAAIEGVSTPDRATRPLSNALTKCAQAKVPLSTYTTGRASRRAS